MFSAKRLADFGYKAISGSMIILTLYVASYIGYLAYDTNVKIHETRRLEQEENTSD